MEPVIYYNFNFILIEKIKDNEISASITSYLYNKFIISLLNISKKLL